MAILNELDINLVYDSITSLFTKILEDRKMHGKEITGVKINSGQVSLYTNNGYGVENRIEEVISANQDDIDIERVEEFIANFPRVNMVGEAPNEKNYTGSRKYIILLTGRRTITDKTIDEDSKFQGLELTYSKKVIYIDESEESIRDKREYKEKMASFQVPDIQNFAIHMLLTNGFRKGYYIYNTAQVYGLDNRTNEPKYIGTMPHGALTETYRKDLSFIDSSFSCKTISLDDKNIFFIAIPEINQIEINNELKKILNRHSGIVILDSFNSYDLINSNLINESRSRQIWYAGRSHIPNKSRFNLITINQSVDVTPKIVNTLGSSYYNWVIDDENKLSIDQIIKIADNNLVIIGANLTELREYFRKFDQVSDTTYKSFFNRVLYMGSIYTSCGIVVDSTIRNMIFENNYGILGNIIEQSGDLEDNLFKIFESQKFDCREANIRNNTIYIETDKIQAKLRDAGVIDNNAILKLIWKTLDEDNADEFLTKLKKVGSYTTQIWREQKENRGFYTILKLNLLANGNKILLKARKLQDPSKVKILSEVNQNKGSINILVGGRSAGKTGQLKAILFNNSVNKRVYVYDSDYDISEEEFKDAKDIIIDRDIFRVSTLKTFDPEIVVINGEIDTYEFMEMINLTSDSSSIYIGSTYDILDAVLTKKDVTYDTYKLENVLKRVSIINVPANTLGIKDYTTEYNIKRINVNYQKLDFGLLSKHYAPEDVKMGVGEE